MTRSPGWPAYRAAAMPFGAFILMGGFWGAWAALVPDVAERTGATPPELGAALLWVGAGALPAMILTGRLWARFGRRLVVLTLLLFGVAAIGPALVDNVFLLALSLALVGAASGGLDVAMNSAISDIEAWSERRLMYLSHALFSLAVLLTSVSVGLLREAGVGPTPVLAAVAAAFVLATAIAVVADRRVPAERSVPAPQAVAPLPRLHPTIALLGALCAAAFLIEDALVSWSALHLERSLGAPPAIGGAGPGVFAGAMFLGRALGQLLARQVAEFQLLVGAGSAAALGILLAAWASVAELALLGLLVAGGGISLVAPALFSRAGRLAGPRHRGAALSTLTVLGYLGFVAGPPLVGLIAGATDLRVSFSMLAALALTLALVAGLALARDRAARRFEEELPPVARA